MVTHKQEGGKSTVEVLPEEPGVPVPHWGHQPGPALGRWAPRMSGFENQWGLCLELEAGGPSLKGTCKNLLAPSPYAEAAVWKESGSDILADLRESCGETGGSWDSPWELTCLWQLFHYLSLPCWRRPWWLLFWNSPSSLLAPGLAPSTSTSATPSLATIKGLMQPIQGTVLENLTLVIKGEHAAGLL